MTDAEINLAIAKLEYPETRNLKLWVEQNMVSYTDGWYDTGPIIERENIGVRPVQSGWEAFHGGSIVIADTPTKAAALCYLKMKGVGGGNEIA